MEFKPEYIFFPVVLILSISLSLLFVDFHQLTSTQNQNSIQDLNNSTNNLNNQKNTSRLNITQFANLTLEKAIELKNSSNCQYLKNLKEKQICELKLNKCEDDDCFYNKAVFERNEEYCFAIKNTSKRIGCSANIKRNLILQESILKNNISICDEFEDNANKEFCYNNFYFGKRLNEDNLTYCDQITNQELKTECLKEKD